MELSRCEAKDFRRLGMTANYLAMDRPDIQFAVNQICREMSIPKVTGLKKLKKLARYLRGALEVAIHFRAGKKRSLRRSPTRTGQGVVAPEDPHVGAS